MCKLGIWHFRTYNAEIFDGEVFFDGPVLPYSAWDSCVVEFEPNVVFITGGFLDTEKAYLINVDSAEVNACPHLFFHRLNTSY